MKTYFFSPVGGFCAVTLPSIMGYSSCDQNTGAIRKKQERFHPT